MTINDPRFTSIHSDPRFIKPNRKKNKKKEHENEDKRFSAIEKDSLTRKKKGTNAKSIEIPKVIDYARGRVILESSDEEEEEAEEEEEEGDTDDSDVEEDIELGPQSRTKKSSRRRRGEEELEIDLNEDSVEEEQADNEESSANHIHPTHRIAIVNLDWDNLKPIDIYKVFSSLLVPPIHKKITSSNNMNPSKQDEPVQDKNGSSTTLTKTVQGTVKRVRFYKSEFGKERMKKEDVEGPPREIFKTKSSKLDPDHDDDDDDDDDSDSDSDSDLVEEDRGGEFDDEALRKYQLDRLRYFYAVVELDSPRSAQHIFAEIDGTEFERTANIFDLSYVPDHMSFDDADLWEECTQDSNDYKGVDFSTDVLRHSKVKLTWDSEDPVRKKYTRLNTQKLTQEELDELDFKSFIAPGSSESELEDEEEEEEDKDGGGGGAGRKLEEPKGKHARLRQLLGLAGPLGSEGLPDGDGCGGQQEEEEELDITFKPGFVDLHHPPSAPALPDPIPATTTTTKKSRNQKIKAKLKKPAQPACSELGDDDDDDDDHHGAAAAQQEKEVGTAAGAREKKKKQEAELELLMLPDPSGAAPGGAEEGGDIAGERSGHFDLAQIMKREKQQAGKKSKSKKRKDRAGLAEQLHHLPPDPFALDHHDPRFVPALVHDPAFAIDPSNPHFKKTKNMLDLLHATRTKRSHSHTDAAAYAAATTTAPASSSSQPRSVSQLVSHLKQTPHPPSNHKPSKRIRVD
ncbi:hypothetical protein PCANC_04600 [Puccinia coronata f. sp. avenae]|uniref:Uncharacterized protein n=1 Tax=Puccinia coronata f. sp. avenae TaxID=200324 RepID=A0A2N5W0E8_9BASI|nr:hypothetical protein PCANC_04600 [Puccinia coronata f. sp. avenae]